MKKLIRIIIYLLIISMIYTSYSITPIFITKSRVGRSRDMVVTAHRASAGLAPENTIPAVKKSLEQQVNRIEVDVRQTSDDKIIAMHDSTINRTTDGQGLVRNFTYSELQDFDAGKWFSSKYAGTKIPDLQQIIDTINGKAELVIDIMEGNKTYPGIEENIIEIISQSPHRNKIIIQASSDDVIFRIHNLEPDIRIFKKIIADTPLFFYDADGFNFNNFSEYDFVEEFTVNQYFASYRLINKVKKMRKKLNVQVIQSREKAQKFMKMNIDGVITDYPNFFNSKIQ